MKLASSLEGYSAEPGSYDEMVSSGGILKSSWKGFMDYFKTMSSDQIGKLTSDINRQILENGITYNLHGDPDGFNRPWKLDPMPFIIDGADWQLLDKGLKQRAELMNLILTDLYGSRDLVKKGILPLELVYNHSGFLHSGFLRPCDQIRTPGKNQLFLYAADLARRPDERMWVINDRTQAPSGIGYALENRTVMANVMPQLFKDLEVHRLSSFSGECELRFRLLLPSLAESSYCGANPR